MINPNDPEENPDAFYTDVPPAPAVAAASKPRHEQHSSGEDGEVRRVTESPAPYEVGARRPINDSAKDYGDRGMNSGDPTKRGNRVSGTPDHSIERSPLHPHYQARGVNKGVVNSPSWERKGSSVASHGSHGFAPSTPGRSKVRSVARGDETPERSAAVPKFGDWDENNPASADGYTHIFNKVREEKQTAAAKVPVMPTESSYHNGHKRDNSQDFEQKWCCFRLSRK